MNEPLILPFGYLRDHLLAPMKLRNLSEMPTDGPGHERVIAIGVPGADEDPRVEQLLERWVASIDSAVIFTGMRFERSARIESVNSLKRVLELHGVAVELVDEEVALRGVGLDATMAFAFDRIANDLLDRIPSIPA